MHPRVCAKDELDKTRKKRVAEKRNKKYCNLQILAQHCRECKDIVVENDR